MHRLRIFAGPNGSGKSTLHKQLYGQINLGHYLNPDDLHQRVCQTLMLDFADFDCVAKQSEWASFWQSHGLSQQAPLLSGSRIENNILVFMDKPKSYESAILSDFLRHQLLKTGQTFSFETVFSHPSKMDFMEKANAQGYKCYLYFAAVSSPEISVARVRQRTLEGGHNVPEDKIRKRYFLTLENLASALRFAHRAYLFDNSTDMQLIAEMTPDKELVVPNETSIPVWLQESVLDKLKKQ